MVSVKAIVSLRSSLFCLLSGKQESRESSGTEYVRATSPWLSLSPAKRKRKRLLRRLGHSMGVHGHSKTEMPDAIRQKHSQEYFQSKIGRKKEKEKGVHTQRAFERDE